MKMLTRFIFGGVAGLLPFIAHAQAPILLNINSSTYPTACTAAHFQALGIPGLSSSTPVSQFSPAFNVGLVSPMNFTNGGPAIFLSSTANGGTYVKPAGAGATNGLMDCYLWVSTASPITMTVSNLNLTPGTNYTLYLIGTLPSVGNNEDGTFQPVNSPNLTFSSTASGLGLLIAPFTTSAAWSSTDTLKFTWAKSPTFNGSFQGLAIVPGAPPAPTQTLTITNGVQKFTALTNTTVNLSNRCELWLSNAILPLSGCVINLTSPDSWLFLPNVKPSIAVLKTYLGQIRINGAAAVADSNCRVVQYGLNGTVIIPQAAAFQPLTVYTGGQFTGTPTSYGQWTYYTGNGITNIGSFKLKRGYQAVLAQSANGASYSKCYVAQDGDLEIGLLPATLEKQVRFIYVTPWRWVPKKGIAGNLGIAELNVGSWYNWDISASSSRDTEYVAIRQQPYWPGLGQNWKALGVNTVLGYNEPDNSGQDAYKNLTPPGSVSDAVARSPDLLATGLRIGSPATTDGGRSGWLYPFINQSDAAGYRVDFVAQHYYWCYDPANPSGAATQMYNFLLDIWNNTHRPIWITEWNNGANWTGCADPTFAQQSACISAMVDMLENAPFVERYQLYSWVEEVRQTHYNAGGLTPAGITYRDKASNLSYLQTMPDNGTRSIAQLLFNTNLWDSSSYCNNAMAVGAPSYTAGHAAGAQAISLDGANSYVQLPANIAKGSAFTFAAWVNWTGGSAWQRIFDFGNDTSQYLFLTPNSGSGTLRFAIKNGGAEQIVERAGALASGSWQHVAVTLNGNTAILYVNGAPVATSTSFSIVPSAFNPTRNFLGKSQWPDPLFNGKLDGVEIADYALSAAQMAALYSAGPNPTYTSGVWTNNASDIWSTSNNWSGGLIANGIGRIADFSTLNITADRTVTLDSARTTGGLKFGDTTGAQNWFLTGAPPLTLDAGAANTAAIVVNQNTATISTPLVGSSGFTKSGGGTLALNATNNLGGSLVVQAGTVNITGGTTTFGAGTSTVGYRTGSGNLSMTGGLLRLGGELRVGGSDVSGTAYNATGAATLSNATLTVGALTIARGNYLDNPISGTVTLNNGSTLVSTNDVIVQFAGTGRGKLAVNGGNFIVGPAASKWLMIGYYDSGGGELNLTNGNLLLENGSSIKMCLAGNTGGNVINQVGGAVTFYSDGGVTVGGGGNLDLNYAGGASSVNTYRLNSGTLTVPQIIASAAAGSSIFNFNGGTLRPTASNAAFLRGLTAANVQAGGARIDTAGFNITIGQALLNGGGGLTKLGAGTLTLTNVNTYAGPTTIGGGTLTLSGSGSINNSTSINLSNGAALNVSGVSFTLGAGKLLQGDGGVTGAVTINGTVAPGNSVGTLAFSTAPALNGTTLMELDRDNPQGSDRMILGSGILNYGGTLTVNNVGADLQAGDTFQLFSAPGYGGSFAAVNLPALNPGLAWSNSLAVAGNLTVIAMVSLIPTNITYAASSGDLTLSWPADHTGWRLQVQTNSLATGLDTNWFDVAGSTATNSVITPVNPMVDSVFYRLIYP